MLTLTRPEDALAAGKDSPSVIRYAREDIVSATAGLLDIEVHGQNSSLRDRMDRDRMDGETIEAVLSR
jgi:hypothetical protein